MVRPLLKQVLQEVSYSIADHGYRRPRVAG